MVMRWLPLGFALLLTPLAGACYNDRDTLGFELENRPNVQRALTGRFERNPAQYYAMRVERLRAKPSLTAAEYDDLAVALDRQGKGEEALAAIEKKGKLPNLSKDDRYRFYANRGTIHAHHWLHEGAKASQIAEIKQAEADIAQALKINPNAHFGREAAQLEVIRWLISVKANRKHAVPLAEYLDKHLPEDIDETESLSGLIMLGAAWESPDVALALAYENSGGEVGAVGTLAFQRYKELLAAGKKPIDPALAKATVDELKLIEGQAADKVQIALGHYRDLRKEADKWHDDREKYMLARFEQGKHPDTDPKFWAGWTEPKMPEVPAEHDEARYMGTFYLVLGIFLALLIGIPVTLVVLYRRWRKRQTVTIL